MKYFIEKLPQLKKLFVYISWPNITDLVDPRDPTYKDVSTQPRFRFGGKQIYVCHENLTMLNLFLAPSELPARQSTLCTYYEVSREDFLQARQSIISTQLDITVKALNVGKDHHHPSNTNNNNNNGLVPIYEYELIKFDCIIDTDHSDNDGQAYSSNGIHVVEYNQQQGYLALAIDINDDGHIADIMYEHNDASNEIAPVEKYLEYYYGAEQFKAQIEMSENNTNNNNNNNNNTNQNNPTSTTMTDGVESQSLPSSSHDNTIFPLLLLRHLNLPIFIGLFQHATPQAFLQQFRSLPHHLQEQLVVNYEHYRGLNVIAHERNALLPPDMSEEEKVVLDWNEKVTQEEFKEKEQQQQSKASSPMSNDRMDDNIVLDGVDKIIAGHANHYDGQGVKQVTTNIDHHTVQQDEPILDTDPTTNDDTVMSNNDEQSKAPDTMQDDPPHPHTNDATPTDPTPQKPQQPFAILSIKPIPSNEWQEVSDTWFCHNEVLMVPETHRNIVKLTPQHLFVNKTLIIAHAAQILPIRAMSMLDYYNVVYYKYINTHATATTTKQSNADSTTTGTQYKSHKATITLLNDYDQEAAANVLQNVNIFKHKSQQQLPNILTPLQTSYLPHEITSVAQIDSLISLFLEGKDLDFDTKQQQLLTTTNNNIHDDNCGDDNNNDDEDDEAFLESFGYEGMQQFALQSMQQILQKKTQPPKIKQQEQPPPPTTSHQNTPRQEQQEQQPFDPFSTTHLAIRTREGTNRLETYPFPTSTMTTSSTGFCSQFEPRIVPPYKLQYEALFLKQLKVLPPQFFRTSEEGDDEDDINEKKQSGEDDLGQMDAAQYQFYDHFKTFHRFYGFGDVFPVHHIPRSFLKARAEAATQHFATQQQNLKIKNEAKKNSALTTKPINPTTGTTMRRQMEDAGLSAALGGLDFTNYEDFYHNYCETRAYHYKAGEDDHHHDDSGHHDHDHDHGHGHCDHKSDHKHKKKSPFAANAVYDEDFDKVFGVKSRKDHAFFQDINHRDLGLESDMLVSDVFNTRCASEYDLLSLLMYVLLQNSKQLMSQNGSSTKISSTQQQMLLLLPPWYHYWCTHWPDLYYYLIYKKTNFYSLSIPLQLIADVKQHNGFTTTPRDEYNDITTIGEFMVGVSLKQKATTTTTTTTTTTNHTPHFVQDIFQAPQYTNLIKELNTIFDTIDGPGRKEKRFLLEQLQMKQYLFLILLTNYLFYQIFEVKMLDIVTFYKSALSLYSGLYVPFEKQSMISLKDKANQLTLHNTTQSVGNNANTNNNNQYPMTTTTTIKDLPTRYQVLLHEKLCNTMCLQHPNYCNKLCYKIALITASKARPQGSLLHSLFPITPTFNIYHHHTMESLYSTMLLNISQTKLFFNLIILNERSTTALYINIVNPTVWLQSSNIPLEYDEVDCEEGEEEPLLTRDLLLLKTFENQHAAGATTTTNPHRDGPEYDQDGNFVGNKYFKKIAEVEKEKYEKEAQQQKSRATAIKKQLHCLPAVKMQYKLIKHLSLLPLDLHDQYKHQVEERRANAIRNGHENDNDMSDEKDKNNVNNNNNSQFDMNDYFLHTDVATGLTTMYVHNIMTSCFTWISALEKNNGNNPAPAEPQYQPVTHLIWDEYHINTLATICGMRRNELPAQINMQNDLKQTEMLKSVALQQIQQKTAQMLNKLQSGGAGGLGGNQGGNTLALDPNSIVQQLLAKSKNRTREQQLQQAKQQQLAKVNTDHINYQLKFFQSTYLYKMSQPKY